MILKQGNCVSYENSAVDSSKQKAMGITKTKKNMVSMANQQSRSKPTHPSTPDMVIAAIKYLKERNGSSFQAIKKYISMTYVLDIEKHELFIKKYLRSGLASGALVQTKGKGMTGSFKLGKLKTEKAKSKPSQATNKNRPESPKKSSSPKKITTPKKANSNVETTAISNRAISTATALSKTTSPGKRSPIKKAVVNKKRKTAKGPAAKPPKPKSSGQSWSKSKVTKALPKKQTANIRTTPTKPKRTMAKKVSPKKK